MKSVLWIPASCALILTLSSCGNSGGGSAGPGASTGPFDSRGNYVEEWADNPSKWRKSGGSSPHDRQSDELPEIALNDQPPSNSVPLPPSNPNKSVPVISQTKPPTQVTSTPRSTSRSSSSSSSTASTSSRPKPTATASKPKPKPVLVKAKPKAKPKPKSVRYVVKKGDSLSSIASRNGTSVSALKSANGISGTLIRPGQSLTIPKRRKPVLSSSGKSPGEKHEGQPDLPVRLTSYLWTDPGTLFPGLLRGVCRSPGRTASGRSGSGPESFDRNGGTGGKTCAWT